MKNFNGKISFFIVCAILGIILSIQFKTTQNVTGGDNPTVKSKKLASELEQLEKMKEEYNTELASIESKIKQLEQEEASKNYYLKTLYEELKKYSIFLGYEDAQGPGIQIEINEPQIEAIFDDGTNIMAENYELLMQILSYLNSANAEAISINDIRYTSYSVLEKENNAIVCDGHIINMPIIIKAIGDPKALESIVTFNGGVLDTIQRTFLFKINVSKKDNLIIPRLNKKIELKYAKPIEKIEG